MSPAPVSGQETAGAIEILPPVSGAAAPRDAAGRAPQSFPDLDTDSLAAVCDCDVDAIVGWHVWRAIQFDALIEAGIAAVQDLVAMLTVGQSLPPIDSVAEMARATKAETARAHGLSPLP
ncbi:hypothetical protein SEA_DOGFISH_36 [Gordonia phage Dogfish]|nr:hypothetical protein SEA_DOGFISH_36 [Gordonia phage Dogfish]